MLASSALSQPGDQVTLLSVQLKQSSNSLLSLYYYMQLDVTDTVAALTLYQYSQLHTYGRVLLAITGNRGGKWQKATVCLPAGGYQLAFVVTMGFSYLSDVAIDDVDLTNDSSCEPDAVFVNNGELVRLKVGGQRASQAHLRKKTSNYHISIGQVEWFIVIFSYRLSIMQLKCFNCRRISGV